MHLRHKWRLAAAHHGVYRAVNGQEVEHFTWLLYLCGVCPTFKVKTIPGHWSREDLDRKDDE